MAQIMSRDHGYVYYEADCFFMFVNPFVDPNVEEPTLMMSGQKPLKVITPYEIYIVYVQTYSSQLRFAKKYAINEKTTVFV